MNCIGFSSLSLQISLLMTLSGLCVTADDGKVEIKLDVRDTGKEISPLLFGHNLEVTRRGIWSGLSADMVANRKFAAVANNMPIRWQAIGTDCQAGIDDTTSYADKQSLCICATTTFSCI